MQTKYKYACENALLHPKLNKKKGGNVLNYASSVV